MLDIFIGYEPSEGQITKIAERISGVLRDRGHEVSGVEPGARTDSG